MDLGPSGTTLSVTSTLLDENLLEDDVDSTDERGLGET
jgi:hypothetical protein